MRCMRPTSRMKTHTRKRCRTRRRSSRKLAAFISLAASTRPRWTTASPKQAIALSSYAMKMKPLTTSSITVAARRGLTNTLPRLASSKSRASSRNNCRAEITRVRATGCASGPPSSWPLVLRSLRQWGVGQPPPLFSNTGSALIPGERIMTQRSHQWHRWFAWRPVIVSQLGARLRIAWLRSVERRWTEGITSGVGPRWIYRQARVPWTDVELTSVPQDKAPLVPDPE